MLIDMKNEVLGRERYKGTKIDLLNDGYIRIVDFMGSDLSIVRAARASYDAAWRAGENEGSDARLIRYLMRNQHSTPFEAVEFQFEVKPPIFVFRQWVRHRTHSYNEVSARYTELPEEFYVPEVRNIGTQSKVNKQARDISKIDLRDISGEVALRDAQIDFYEKSCAGSFADYRQLLEWEWPREIARAVLPLATYTKSFDKMNLWNLFKFLDLRSDALNDHQQYEIRVFANAIVDLIEPIVPVAVTAWKERNAKWRKMEELYAAWEKDQ